MSRKPDLDGVTVLEVWAYAQAEAVSRDNAGNSDAADRWRRFAAQLEQVAQLIRVEKEGHHEKPNV